MIDRRHPRFDARVAATIAPFWRANRLLPRRATAKVLKNSPQGGMKKNRVTRQRTESLNLRAPPHEFSVAGRQIFDRCLPHQGRRLLRRAKQKAMGRSEMRPRTVPPSLRARGRRRRPQSVRAWWQRAARARATRTSLCRTRRHSASWTACASSSRSPRTPDHPSPRA